MTAAVEDYLKTIWHLRAAGRRASPVSVAERRVVSGASASVMLRRLEEAGLVARGTDAEVLLTERGEVEALRVVRRHRLLETFLVQVCGLGWDEVHDEAEVLEHVLSDRLERRIDELLGNPAFDPHGDPIPPRGGVGHDEGWSDPLAGAEVGCRFLVERVSDRDSAALRHLAGLGIAPGAVLAVQARDPFGGPLWVVLEPSGGSPQPLGSALVDLLHGRVLPA